MIAPLLLAATLAASAPPLSPDDLPPDELTPSPSAPRMQRTALLVGNWNYGADEIDLNSPPQDVAAMKAKLTQLKFDRILVEENVDRAGLIAALQKARNAAKDGMLFFYYSGHAISLEGSNWLLPVDEELKEFDDVSVSAVSVSQVLRILSGTKLRVVVLDACRTNPFSLGGKAAGVGGLTRDSLDALEGTLVAYAAAPGTVAYDGKKGDISPFTRALLRHLSTPGLDLPNVFMNARGELHALTKDAPRGPQRSEEVSSLTQVHRFSFVQSTDVAGVKSAPSGDIWIPQRGLFGMSMLPSSLVVVSGVSAAAGLVLVGGGAAGLVWAEAVADDVSADPELRGAAVSAAWPATLTLGIGASVLVAAGAAGAVGAGLALLE